MQRVLPAAFLLCVLVACGDSDGGMAGEGGTGAAGGSGGGVGDPQLVVTADWLNRTLTLFDHDKLIDGTSDAASSIVDTVDLSTWVPGPLELELTSDGAIAVVSIGPGFFQGGGGALIGSPEVPDGGKLLVIDIATRSVVAEIDTMHAPMGIAISPDGTRAYTANYGTENDRGETMSIVDLVAGTLVDEIVVGGRPEQVVLNADGSLGAINLAAEDGIRMFETSDVEGTLTAVLPTGNDPSGLVFLGSDDRLAVANSQGPSLSLVDSGDLDALSVIHDASLASAPYGVTYLTSTGGLVLTTGFPVSFLRIAVIDDALAVGEPIALTGSPFPLVTAVDTNEAFAFVPHAADGGMSIIDLRDDSARTITWLSESGPMYVAVQP